MYTDFFKTFSDQTEKKSRTLLEVQQASDKKCRSVD